ncbi:MAG: hypothetical protein WB780_02525 [Candidatus Acidiferrales bacterium]
MAEKTAESVDASLPLEVAAQPAAAPNFAHFWHEYWLRINIISALILVPCLWLPRIEAGDLRSHLYNAWLVQLIERGQAPGLFVVHQWNNVLFDLLLNGLGRVFSLHVAERLAVPFVVLIFFWGAFSFIGSAAGRAPWTLVPLIATISYGWTYQEGLFNYYLSIGLAFCGLAIFWRGRRFTRLAVIVLSPVLLLAHPYGVALLAGGALYVAVAEVIPRRFRWLPLLAAIGPLLFARIYLGQNYRLKAPVLSVEFYNGLDQFIFGYRYLIPAAAFAAFIAVALGSDLLRRRRERDFPARYAIPLELYLIVEAAVLLLPDGIYLPQYAAPVGHLTERLTLASTVLLCCPLAAMKARKWHLRALAAIALVFFAFLYRDTGRINRMEAQVERLVHTLPPGQRVLDTVIAPGIDRFSFYHMVDRACIGYCFSYGNYEAPSKQFRVRAWPGNPYVMTEVSQASAMEHGDYVVQAHDLPVYQVYQCGAAWTELCIRPLEAGEANDRLGVH